MGTNGTNTANGTSTANANQPSMNWVMVLWLISFLAVVIFGVGTYLLGWIFRRG
jgi:hypothetical protein